MRVRFFKIQQDSLNHVTEVKYVAWQVAILISLTSTLPLIVCLWFCDKMKMNSLVTHKKRTRQIDQEINFLPGNIFFQKFQAEQDHIESI